MKFTIAVASIFLAVAGATSAIAQGAPSLSVTINPTPQTWTGSPLVFGGTITNTGSVTLNPDSDSIAMPSAVGYTDEYLNNVLLGSGLSLTPGQSYTTPDLFTITGGVTSSFTGTFSTTDSTVGVTGNGDFRVNVPGSVPEPGSMALLASSLLGGGFLLRRRK
jgi:hypothetical protein